MSIALCGYINFTLFFINSCLYMNGRSPEFIVVGILNALAAAACLARVYSGS